MTFNMFWLRKQRSIRHLDRLHREKMDLTYSGLLYRRFGKEPLELFTDSNGKEFAKLGPSKYTAKMLIPMSEWAERQEPSETGTGTGDGTGEEIDLSIYDI